MSVNLECRGQGLGQVNAAGIAEGDYFFNTHFLTEADKFSALILAGQDPSQPTTMAKDVSLRGLTSAWLVIAACSAGYAVLPESKGQTGTVVFSKLDISFLKEKLAGLNSSVELSTLASRINGPQGLFSTEVSQDGKTLVQAVAALVFDPFPVTKEYMDMLAQQAHEAKQARNALSKQDSAQSKPPVITLPAISYKVTEEKGIQTADISKDGQDLHNPRSWVRASRDGLLFDGDGKVIVYRGRQEDEYDIRYGELTRFRSPIAHGVLTFLPAAIGLARVQELVAPDSVILIDQASTTFIGPVRYGFTLNIEEKLAGVEDTGGEPLEITEISELRKLREGRLTMVVACATEAGPVLKGKFILELAPFEKIAA